MYERHRFQICASVVPEQYLVLYTDLIEGQTSNYKYEKNISKLLIYRFYLETPEYPPA